MANKKDYCPLCFAELEPVGKGVKMGCPTPGCTFQDRRFGTSILPDGDRREGEKRFVIMRNNQDPWRSEKKWR